MKAQEGGAVRTPPGDAAPPSDTGGQVELTDEDFGDLNETTEKSVVERSPLVVGGGSPAVAPHRPAAHLPRERRQTVVSSIPALLARSMGEVREPGVPAPLPAPEVTRPVPDELAVELMEEVGGTYNVEVVDEPSLPPRAHIESLVLRARSFMDGGNLGAAVIAADQALAEAAKAPATEVADLVKAARPLFDRIFAAYVGLLGQTPVRVLSDEQLAGRELGERTTHLLSHIDGARTLEQVATSSGIPAVEAMKLAASLLAARIVRV